ncbi:unnamed protein product [Rotaria socialis]|uniref:Uncharacterized protein n=1 Tax=Rotaria socialis TaxID=392032 RepID=A0A821ADX6_9BILA|nr:unnamed protein product [Rotaria socialis]CAF3249114.1 unnamed protein product [Rotaria socialis]CAF3462311.1 unnamed protein product [Rotaria socialis]CAF4246670.1 unnamed protein product [Rotaria socialis]CAF4403828.1 unnamed protein product [Rotaria socialis]
MSFFKQLFGLSSAPAEDNIRVIITRHGERADLALGPRWLSRVRRNGAHHSGVSYLTPRSDLQEWTFDPPLTIDGERQSSATGRKLLQLGYPIDYCYASPAYRSIQTANKILESQGRRAVQINIEPGLFECPLWYASASLSFVPPADLAMDRYFNVNPYYTPIYDEVDPEENESNYYERSRLLIDSITKTHKNQGGTILLSGHAGSIEALTRGMLRRRARPERLMYEAEKVNYCNFAILERDARTRRWVVHSPPQSNEDYYIGQSRIRSTIPLYSATSQYIVTNYSNRSSLSLKHHFHGNKSFTHYPYK